MRGHGEFVEEVNVRIRAPVVVRETGADQRIRHGSRARDMDPAAVQERARAAFGREQLIPRGVENHAGNHLPVLFQPQRHVPDRKTVRKVGGAVQRIDKPAILRRTLVSPALLGDNAMRREGLLQPLDHQFLRSAVRLGHQIELALHFKPHTAFKVVPEQRTRVVRDLNRSLKKRCHAVLSIS